MPFRFIILMMNTNPGLTIGDVQSALNERHVQWCRIANNVWIIHTQMPPTWLDGFLSPLASPSGSYFLSPLTLGEHEGRLAKEVWDWISSRLSRV